eukprot:s136_g22.t1
MDRKHEKQRVRLDLCRPRLSQHPISEVAVRGPRGYLGCKSKEQSLNSKRSSNLQLESFTRPLNCNQGQAPETWHVVCPH